MMTYMLLVRFNLSDAAATPHGCDERRDIPELKQLARVKADATI